MLKSNHIKSFFGLVGCLMWNTEKAAEFHGTRRQNFRSNSVTSKTAMRSVPGPCQQNHGGEGNGYYTQ